MFVRLAARLAAAGVRAVRMNLRGAGAGFGASRGIYHGGRSADVRAAAAWLAARAAGSPLALVGFSLGANLVLKLAAEAASEPLAGLDCVLAASPPLDLEACCRQLSAPRNRVYDVNFVASLKREVARLHAAHPDLGRPRLDAVRTLFGFDDAYTAPRHGFAGALDYYARSSAGPLLGRVAVPGLIVHAADDPFIPAEVVTRWRRGPGLELDLTEAGGHLGWIAARPIGPGGDRRWLDARLFAWLAARWAGPTRSRRPAPAHDAISADHLPPSPTATPCGAIS